jgi:GNAT superfamily N-acetyltransferase
VTDVSPLTKKDAAERARLIHEATQIFFETANIKAFESAAAQDAFYQRWFGRYLKADPASFFLALDGNGAAIGYLAGCLDSFAESARSIIESISFYTPPFCSALRDYPSHFHINVKPGFQGQGVGRLLLARFVQLCRDRGSPGIHVVTGATSRAITFYRMCGFAPFAIPDADPGLAVLVYATPAP